MSDPIRLCPTCRHPLILPLPRREGRCAVLVEMVHPGDFDPCGCADPAHTRPRGRFALLGSFGASTRRARATAPLRSGTAREQPAD
ncbi:hypothetical protein GCM10010988_27710 [Cnuibacter physcomitrellae]|uniref:hypothetical protein n=1 Tax=Cnuibacter physcomitrellae TaxID=1619308 RepID=UPI0012F50656|nr:hypothetical protein [Cnuibacter physcomitrellae]GGI40164.1 hypothetical protein GCM10010988_27710 [Cnuibacter physcomitrellae]